MLLNKDQKREFSVDGRKIKVSDKHINAFFTMMGFPLTNSEVLSYISASKTKTFVKTIIDNATNEELSKIVEDGIYNEFFDSYGTDAEKIWQSIPAQGG